MTILKRRIITFLVAVVLLTWAPIVSAEGDDVGWVAALEGDAEVLRAAGGTWTPLAPADGLALGDQVRTLEGGRMKILLRDDSILTLGERSALVLDEQMVGDAPVSSFSLLVGKVRALASERYGAAGTRFEMTTPTAVAGVRGTEFFASYDQNEDETLVVGIVHTTMVRSRIDPSGARALLLGPGEATRVRRGAFPTRAMRLPESQLQGLLNATTAKRDLSGGLKKGKQKGLVAEPRRPHRPGGRAASPAGRVVDQPGIVKPGRRGPAPPPPPVPGR